LRVLLQLVVLIRLMIAPREAITVSGRDYVAGGRERMRSGNSQRRKHARVTVPER